MARRVTFSTVLLMGSATLVVAVFVGNSMGNRVLGQIGRLPPVNPTPIGVPTPGTTAAASQTWKHVTLAAIATDPAFPDPRVTPPPEVVAPPAPRIAISAAPLRTPSRTLPVPTAIATFDYTSPPLPMPILTPTPLAPPTFTAAPIVDTPAPAPTIKMTPNAVGP